MTDETMNLSGRISQAMYDHFFGSLRGWTFDGEHYDVADDQQYEHLGEDIDASDLPLILVRKSDGKFFEVDIDASVWETTAEERREKNEQAARMRERVLRQAERYREDREQANSEQQPADA